jgi:hypothetical protein
MLPLACAGALSGATLTGAASAKLVVGVSDNGAAMFSSSRFIAAHVQTARDVVFWNVAVIRNKKALNLTRTWIRAAEQAGVQPLISFGGNGNYIPTVAQYTRAVKAFVRDFPSVKLYTAWNEPDWIYRPALANHPTLAAAYFNALVRSCRHCTVAAGEVYRPASDGLASWIRAYKRGLRYRPAAWAIHNYDDVRGHKTDQLRALESVTKGPIWLTEISGVERRGHWQFKNQNVFGANRDERFLFSLPKRFHRISRIYHFEWQGTVDTPHTGWDSGLIGPGGVPRPAYYTLRSAAAGKLP